MPDPNPITKAATDGSASTEPATASAESSSISKEILEQAQGILLKAKASPDLITFASGVKEAFEKMTKVLSPGDLPEDEAGKTNEGKIAAIQKIGEVGGEKINDSGLKTFANAATKILGIGPEDLPNNSAILNSLITAFGFLGEEGLRKEDPNEDITLSILKAFDKATSSCEGNQVAIDAIKSGFKEAFPGLVEEEKAKSLGEAVEITPTPDLAPAAPPIKGEKLTTASLTPEEQGRELTQEEQRIRDEKEANRDSAMEIMPDALKAAGALTLALAVAPPLGVILAIGFLAYTWDMGHKPKEEKPEIFNDPDVQKHAEAWKKFMEPPKREITAADHENAIKKPTIVGGAASKFAENGITDLNESKKTLKVVEEAVKAITVGNGNLPSSPLGPEEALKEQTETGGEELQELMDRSPVADSEQKAVLSEDHFAIFVDEEKKKLSEEELEASSIGAPVMEQHLQTIVEESDYYKAGREDEIKGFSDPLEGGSVLDSIEVTTTKAAIAAETKAGDEALEQLPIYHLDALHDRKLSDETYKSQDVLKELASGIEEGVKVVSVSDSTEVTPMEDSQAISDSRQRYRQFHERRLEREESQFKDVLKELELGIGESHDPSYPSVEVVSVSGSTKVTLKEDLKNTLESMTSIVTPQESGAALELGAASAEAISEALEPSDDEKISLYDYDKIFDEKFNSTREAETKGSTDLSVEKRLEAAKAEVREVVVEELYAASSQKEGVPLHTETKVDKSNTGPAR